MSDDQSEWTVADTARQLALDLQEVEAERDRLRAEKAHLVEVNAALRTRPDLAERAPLVVALVDERDRLRAVVEAAIGRIEREQFQREPTEDALTEVYRILGDESIAPEPGTSEDGRRNVLDELLKEFRSIAEKRDRLRAVVTGAVLAIETVLMGDHVDMKMPAIEVLGRTSAALKKALDGKEGT